MNDSPNVDKISKLLAMCPNGGIAPVKQSRHKLQDPEVEQNKPENKAKAFFQKVFTLKPKEPTSKRCTGKTLMGCSCGRARQSLEYCTTISTIIRHIEKSESNAELKNRIITIARSNQTPGGFHTDYMLSNDAKNTTKKDHPLCYKNGVNTVLDPILAELDSSNSEEQNGVLDANENSDRQSADDDKLDNIISGDALKSQIDYQQGKISNFYQNGYSGSSNQELSPKDPESSNSTHSDDNSSQTKRITQIPAFAPQEDIVPLIEKDLKRTYQTHKYFRDEEVQFHLRQVVLQVALRFEQIGYVQGMNFIGGGIIYHSNNFVDSAKIFTYLIDNLQMEQIYSFIHFDRYVNVLKKLLKVHAKDFYTFTQKVVQLDYKIHLLDWFFCLGLNKIPLELSHILLEKVVVHGWYYFYRLLVNYFKLFEEKYAKIIKNPALHENRKVDIEVLIKNFHKEKGIDWSSLLKKSTKSCLNDNIIRDELIWDAEYSFLRL